MPAGCLRPLMLMKSHTAFLLLGTNVGDRQLHLQHALKKIAGNTGTIVETSSVYETQPWGVTNQDNYLNMALQLETRLSVNELFEKLQEIEASEGRSNTARNAPRTLDIDILFFDGLVLESERLTIPHPRLHLRRFVLEPLVEIAPGIIHPVLRKPVNELLQDCTDDKNVRRLLSRNK
jgi:2-amino-4-hydroxy-6-hydroxymethyldihydropteridine diphosphokinase